MIGTRLPLKLGCVAVQTRSTLMFGDPTGHPLGGSHQNGEDTMLSAKFFVAT